MLCDDFRNECRQRAGVARRGHSKFGFSKILRIDIVGKSYSGGVGMIGNLFLNDALFI